MTEDEKSSETLEGRVVEVKEWIGSLSLRIELTPERVKQVCLPIKIKNEMESIPYELVLKDERVSLTTEKEITHNCGLTGYTRNETRYQLIILSGKLTNRTYSATKK